VDRPLEKTADFKGRKAMLVKQLTAAAVLSAVVLAVGAEARELTYGSMIPPRNVFNTKSLQTAFDQIKEETKGSITWKLVTGGALLDARGTVPGVKDGIADAGLGIAPYVPNLLPATNMIFSTHVWGNDVVAATGAATETYILTARNASRSTGSRTPYRWAASPPRPTCRCAGRT
jgi:TRAP-type C4-dicarboxylate transport system substrate-binding protein